MTDLDSRQRFRLGYAAVIAWALTALAGGFVAPLKADSEAVPDEATQKQPPPSDAAVAVREHPVVGPGEAALRDVFGQAHGTGDWFGLRSDLEQHGIFVEAALIADVSTNFTGGLKRGTVYRQLFDLNIAFETEPLLGWEGGLLFIDFQNFAGKDGTAELVGDFQAFDNIDADDFAVLYELWYEQVFADGLVVVTIGKVDANGLFAYADLGGEFINSSAGFPPTIVAFPTYPDPAMSVNVFVHPTDWLYAGFGWYDGSSDTGGRGPSGFFHDTGGYFLIGELGGQWELPQGLTGRVAVGGWGHTGEFERLADGAEQDGVTGMYMIVEQTLWRKQPEVADDDQGVGVFMQYGYADPAVSEAEHFLGGGIICNGPLPGRDHDAAGMYLGYAHFSRQAGLSKDGELAIEWMYKYQVTPYFAIKPDLQYILHPGGDAGLDDALVGTVRFEIVF